MGRGSSRGGGMFGEIRPRGVKEKLLPRGLGSPHPGMREMHGKLSIVLHKISHRWKNRK
jgi:hypothetical protein